MTISVALEHGYSLALAIGAIFFFIDMIGPKLHTVLMKIDHDVVDLLEKMENELEYQEKKQHRTP